MRVSFGSRVDLHSWQSGAKGIGGRVSGRCFNLAMRYGGGGGGAYFIFF